MDLRAFDNKHAGRRGFVIGGGPSIRLIEEGGFDMSLLQKEITVGANKAYKLFTPNYLVWGDRNFFRRFERELLELDCTMFYGHFQRTNNEKDKMPPLDDPRFVAVHRVIEGHGRHHIPTSFAGPISFWQNSGVVALRLAFLLGLNPIYLLGMDLGGHQGKFWFHEGYVATGAGKKWYELAGTIFERIIARLDNDHGVDVYSCSSISSLNDVIPYVDIRNLDFKSYSKLV